MKLEVGDRVAASIRGNVVGFDYLGVTPTAAHLDSGITVLLDQPAIKVEKLKPVKPEVGAIITAQRLSDTMWKRGTMIRSLAWQSLGEDRLFVLEASGQWRSLDNSMQWPFSCFHDKAGYEVVFLPDGGR